MALPEFYTLASKIIEPEKNLVAPFDASGVTVHYTATKNFEQAHKALMDRGLNYHFIIERDGAIIQTAKLTHSVYHAGKAMWNGKSPNRHHIAIALVSWGRVEPDGTTWAGTKISQGEIEKRRGLHWHVATGAQEASLINLCRWLVCLGINPQEICGHDECAIPNGRKIDPGGVLSMGMVKLRSLLHSAET